METNLTKLLSRTIYTGETLVKKIDSDDEHRQPLVDGLVYKESILMLAAKSGSGKSMLALQMALQMSSCLPVFGQFYVHNPVKSLYIQAERPMIEIIERIRKMQKVIKADYNNLCFDSTLQGLDMMKPSNCKIAHERIDRIRDKFKFDVLFLDPIYAMVRGGLSKDEPASMFSQFSSDLQARYGCTNILIHHLNRGIIQESGIRSKGDMYGSVWLEAHPTGIFLIEKTKDGTCFINDKNSHGNLMEKFKLVFDKNHNISNLDHSDHNSIDSADRLLMFLRVCERLDKEFTMDDISASIDLSHSQIYRLRARPPIGDGFIDLSINGCKGLYKWRDPRNTSRVA